MSEILAGLLILAGGGFALLAALGILRLPDVMIRMHAATKAGTLASGLIMAGAAVQFDTLPVLVPGRYPASAARSPTRKGNAAGHAATLTPGSTGWIQGTQ